MQRAHFSILAGCKINKIYNLINSSILKNVKSKFVNIDQPRFYSSCISICGRAKMQCHYERDVFQSHRCISKLVATSSVSVDQSAGNGSGYAIQKSISALATKRPTKKKAKHIDQWDQDKDVIMGDKFTVWAYATAETYDLESLAAGLRQQGLYNIMPNPEDMLGVLRVNAAYPTGDEQREILFFSDGVTVLWNIAETERDQVLKFLHQHEEDSYDTQLVQHEAENMDYLYSKGSTRLSNGRFLLHEEVGNELLKYTFSNAMAISVKLSIWEASLDKYIDGMKWVVEDMREGKKIGISRENVLKKTGELFTLKHLINLGSNLLDEPDFYWDRENEGAVFKQTSRFFNIDRRTKVMNEKLSHCCELTDLLISHLNDKHHVRLEWFIIALIAVEVVFEITHFIEKAL